MKLRIRGNSLRLRLTRSEVAQFGDTGSVEEAIEFGGSGGAASQQLIYSLVSSNDIEEPTAVFENGRITVSVPRAQAAGWTESNQVGIEAEKPLGGEGRTLRILIEKDFACLEPRKDGDEDTDAFEHPLQNQPESRLEDPIVLKA